MLPVYQKIDELTFFSRRHPSDFQDLLCQLFLHVESSNLNFRFLLLIGLADTQTKYFVLFSKIKKNVKKFYQLLPGTKLHVISKWICVLKSISAFGQQLGRIEQILPVNPGTISWHHLFLKFRLITNWKKWIKNVKCEETQNK